MHETWASKKSAVMLHIHIRRCGHMNRRDRTIFRRDLSQCPLWEETTAIDITQTSSECSERKYYVQGDSHGSLATVG